MAAARERRTLSLSGEGFQGPCVADGDLPAPQADPPFRFQHLQVLIDHLTGHAEVLRELFLREGEFGSSRGSRSVQACQAQETLGDSRRDAQQRRVLHELRRPANTATKKLYQVRRQLRLRAQQMQETLARENNELSANHCRRGRGSWLPVQQCDLPEGVPGLHDVEKNFLAGRQTGADAHPTGDDSAQGVARIAVHENNRPPLVYSSLSERRDPGDSCRRQATEQAVALNNGCCGDRQELTR